MANFTHSITITWTRGYGDTLSQTVSLSNVAEDNVNLLMTSNNANYFVDMEIDPVKVDCLVMTTDAVNVTVNTVDVNNAVLNTINLAVNVPIIWYTGGVYDIPINNANAVVEGLKITNANTTTNTNFSLRILRGAAD